MKTLAMKRKYEGMSGAWLLIHDAEGKLLVARRSPNCLQDVGMWNWIGGGVDGEETPYEAALREFREEAGIDMSEDLVTHMLSVGNPVDGGTCHFFIASRPANFTPVFNNESDASDWRSAADLMKDASKLNWPTLASLGAVYSHLRSKGLG